MHPLGPTLETERLILRPPDKDGFEGYAALYADEETAPRPGGG